MDRLIDLDNHVGDTATCAFCGGVVKFRGHVLDERANVEWRLQVVHDGYTDAGIEKKRPGRFALAYHSVCARPGESFAPPPVQFSPTADTIPAPSGTIAISEDDANELAWWRTVFASRFPPGHLPKPGTSLAGTRFYNADVTPPRPDFVPKPTPIPGFIPVAGEPAEVVKSNAPPKYNSGYNLAAARDAIPVDRTAVTTTNPNVTAEEARARPVTTKSGQQKAYVILTAEERSKGFVEPVRRSYLHVGPRGPVHPVRDLTDSERQQFGDTFAKAEDYPRAANSVGRKVRYWEQAELDRVAKGGCNTATTMSRDIAETYARDPSFYGKTFCAQCGEHLPVGEDGEFVWVDHPSQRVGTRSTK